MTRLALLLCATALPACSPEPAGNQTAAAPDASATFAPTEVAARPAAHAAKPVVPRPGALKTFGDWTVGCDNTLRCELRSLAPETGEPPDVTIAIARAAGPDARSEITLDGYEDAELDLAADGRRLTGTDTGSPDRAVAAMANARTLTAMIGDRTVASISLKGASAALRYVDAVQGRAGTVTALVARGLKPANRVPAPPAAPTIVALTPGRSAAPPTAAQLADMRRIAGCEAAADLEPPQAHALGGGKTLVLLPCSAGAYNALSAVFVIEAGKVAPVRADAPVGFDPDGKGIPTVVNGDFKDGLLSSYAKARGLGDCGVAQQFVWDGNRLRLTEQRQMGECRGNTDYIRTWTAAVVRR